MRKSILFGTDFDNTVVAYDHLFPEAARAAGVDLPDGLSTKKETRDHVRSLPGGKIAWQKIQSIVYGPGMSGARLIEGFYDFVHLCREQSVPIFIISHKTEFAAQDPNVNLRDYALAWMDKMGFFDTRQLGLSRSQIFFESTRSRKIKRIQKLQCTHFVDDMLEVLLDSSLKRDINKFLIAESGPDRRVNGISVFSSWNQISSNLFGMSN